MGGGLMQLVAYGAQDIYLTGNPQITFFKVVFRRHTNFSMESIRQTWNGQSDTSGTCTAIISRNGDLVHKCYLQLSVTPEDNNNPGSAFIKTVDVEIGGQRIDRQTGSFMEAFAELTQPNPSALLGGTFYQSNASKSIGTPFQRMSGMGGFVTDLDVANNLFVPLQFWFCRNAGNALPLIALQYHEVKIILEHTISDVFTSATNNLYVDYIYLDTDERRRFAQVSHEYLIEQVQTQTVTDKNSNLNFNHPVKELIWHKDDFSDISGSGATFGLSLNGHDRFSERKSDYFTRQQVYDYHTGCGGLGNPSALGPTSAGNNNDSIGVYSFALKPEEHQPSGTCNFSRIDSARFVIDNLTNGSLSLNIYAINYNILRIMSGMGGLAYSN